MDPRDAVLTVLRAAAEPLHWTAIQDRALRAGLLDPFEYPDVRRLVQTVLRTLRDEGAIERRSTGVYAAVDRDADA
ncbi:MAG TPA: hypothetical protein VFQ40_01650 [Actinomycetota bacterium]|nr:hypothetical protein [Actinomycetota bacterium]